MALSYILLTVWLRDVPGTVLWSLVWAPLAVPAIIIAIRYHAVPSRLAPACGLTGLLHLGVGVSMCIALIVA